MNEKLSDIQILIVHTFQKNNYFVLFPCYTYVRKTISATESIY